MSEDIEYANVDDTIDLIADNLDEGNREAADELNEELWNQGGELQEDSEFYYAECLLDMGEIERAGMLIENKLSDISNYVEDYWQVFLKYGFLSGKLKLSASLGEYPNIREQSSLLFDWLDKHQQNYSLRHYEYMLKISLDSVRNSLCAFDILILDNGMLECIFYTAANEEENEQLAAEVSEKVADYFATINLDMPEDLYLAFDNVSNRELSVGSND